MAQNNQAFVREQNEEHLYTPDGYQFDQNTRAVIKNQSNEFYEQIQRNQINNEANNFSNLNILNNQREIFNKVIIPLLDGILNLQNKKNMNQLMYQIKKLKLSNFNLDIFFKKIQQIFQQKIDFQQIIIYQKQELKTTEQYLQTLKNQKQLQQKVNSIKHFKLQQKIKELESQIDQRQNMVINLFNWIQEFKACQNKRLNQNKKLIFELNKSLKEHVDKISIQQEDLKNKTNTSCENCFDQIKNFIDSMMIEEDLLLKKQIKQDMLEKIKEIKSLIQKGLNISHYSGLSNFSSQINQSCIRIEQLHSQISF